ncbi:MAG: hypothetical protein IPH57_00730 [Saprospiraceae bacterium]|nr:hypothetical protein [Saprospiraceae bacterium]
MRKFNIILFFLSVAIITEAQFINNGATVTIQSGATLRIESDFQNNTTGTFTNNGTLEVSGDFTNAATATLTPSVGLIKFIGTANTDLDAGGDALNNVEMAKTGVSGTVTLATSTSLAGNLAFTGTGNNKIILGNFDLTMSNIAATVTATTNHPTNGWVVTDKTGVNNGKFVKNIATGSSTRALELGDDINYSPLSMAVNASSSGTVAARVLTSTLTAKYAETTDYISREWVVSTSNVTSNILTGTYVAGDITGTQSLIKGATYHTGDWRFDGSSGSGNTVTASTTTSDVRLSGMNFFGKANLKVYLAGSMPTNNIPPMRTNLNSLLPSVTPYTAAPFNAPSVTAPSIPGNATDWILVEVRDAAVPSTIISQTSGFLLSDGTIVNYDGTFLKLKNAVANGHIAIRHRNHLGIRTQNSQDLVSTPTLDFTVTTSNPAYIDGGISNPNMRLTGSVYSLWNGDTNQNGSILYSGSGNDSSPILSKVGGTSNATTPVSGYFIEDVDLNGSVLYSGSGNDRSNILSAMGGTGNATIAILQHLN